MRKLSALLALTGMVGLVPSCFTSAQRGANTPGLASKPRTIKRVVVDLSRPSGTDVVTTSPDGSMTVAVDVVENGRGPHVDATIRLAPDGTIAALDARGNHVMGTKVAESFSLEGDTARWSSHEEQGERKLEGKTAFFVPMATIPDALGLLAQALVKAMGTGTSASLPLLPEGMAYIERTGDATVQNRKGTEERHIVSYSITGLDLTPTHVWMNDDGSWWGTVAPSTSIVPDGWDNVIDSLVEKQREIDREREARLARTYAHLPPPGGLAYTHARVLDVVAGRYREDQTVVVVNGTIKTVGPTASVKIPAGAETIDVARKVIVPGLWDMHAHLGDAEGVLAIASGVTTMRDLGNDPDRLDDFKRRFDEGTAIGPRIIRFGLIEGRGEKAASSRVTAETEAEGKEAVAFYAKRGYEGIKIYNSVRPDLVPLLAREAHARGMSVTGHIPVHMLANEAVRAGYDGIEHINMLFLNFFADHETDTRTTKRFTLVGDHAARFDLGSKPARDFFALLAEKKTVIDPTIGIFQELLLGQQGKLIPELEPLVSRLPVQTQRGYLIGGLPLEGIEQQQQYEASFEKVLTMVKTLHDRKIPLVVGTDALAGLSLHHELGLYVRAGIPAATAIRMATLDAARVMKADAKTGSIAAGKTADLVLIDGDPLARIEDIGRVVSTMRGGIVYRSAKLYESVGVRPLL
jgi:Amidohydrolase family